MVLLLLVAVHVALQLVFRPALRYFVPGLVVGSLFTAAGLLDLRGLWSGMRGGDGRARSILVAWGAILALVLANAVYQIAILRQVFVLRDLATLGALLGIR